MYNLEIYIAFLIKISSAIKKYFETAGIIQRSGVIRDRVIGDKKAVLQKVLPWVIGDTSDFGKRFANQNRSFYKYSYKKWLRGHEVLIRHTFRVLVNPCLILFT